MGEVKTDITIIGSGAAGLLSSYYLAKKGLKVLVLTKGYGATAMSSGCFDVLGSINNEFIDSFKDGFDHLNDSHPYKVISGSNLNKFINLLRSAIKDIGELFSLYIGEANNNVKIITFMGSIRPTAFVQKSMRGAIIIPGANYLFLGFKGLYDYNPNLQAKMLKSFAKLIGIRDINAQAKVVELDKQLPSIHFLQIYLRNRDHFEKFLSILEKVSEMYSPQAILIPAVFDDINYILKIEEIAPLYEIPSPPPYRAGLRLNNLLWKIAEEKKVIIRHVEELKPVYGDGEIKKLIAFKGGKQIEVISDKYILATGDLVGGGLKVISNKLMTKKLIDTVFNIPISEFNHNLFNPDIFGVHRYKELGFRVDQELIPIDSKGKPYFINLHAVGAVIGGYDYIEEKSGLGVPLLTAYKLASEIIKEL